MKVFSPAVNFLCFLPPPSIISGRTLGMILNCYFPHISNSQTSQLPYCPILLYISHNESPIGYPVRGLKCHLSNTTTGLCPLSEIYHLIYM
jgi:hypothetical protein